MGPEGFLKISFHIKTICLPALFSVVRWTVVLKVLLKVFEPSSAVLSDANICLNACLFLHAGLVYSLILSLAYISFLPVEIFCFSFRKNVSNLTELGFWIHTHVFKKGDIFI